MTKLSMVSFQLVLVIMFVALVAGVVHWLEDAYVREDTPIIGSVIGRANVIHHHLPCYLTRNAWWQRSWDLLAFSALIECFACRLDLLTWRVWLFAAISANANEVHEWSHHTRKENGRIITFLQSIRLLQTPNHRAVHHTNPKNVRYCPITNLVTPILDRFHVWADRERLLAHALGLHRRPETSLPGAGPAPAWLQPLHGQSKAKTARTGPRT